MSILCCRRGDPNAAVNKQVTLPPKILGRITTPRPQTSRQNIEAFYNEGRELFNARQEEKDKSSLQSEIKEEPRDPGTPINGEEASIASKNDRVAEHDHGTRRPSKASSAIELRGSIVSAVSDSSSITVPAESMPALTISLISGAVEPGSRSAQERDISHHALTPFSPEEAKAPSLPQEFPVNTPVIPRVEQVAVPSTPDLSPYLMPSIATTIASINGKSRSGITIPTLEDNLETGKLSLEQNSEEKDVETADELREDCTTVKPEIRLDKADEKDGTTADDEEATTPNTENSRNTKHQSDASGDVTTSRNDFTPNELFSKIPTWVRPSTSTFMSFPSSHDHNRKDGLGSSPSTGSATPELTKSNSTRFYSPLEATSANSTGVNTPAFVCPPTPGYEFRSSIDNTSSFYPSPGTSRCVSLAESEKRTPESSALSTDADTRMLNRTPRPSDMIIDSPGGSPFKFPWVNRSRNKSPEPIANEGAFTRGSSLAHLKKAQNRGRELQRGPGTNSKFERAQDVVANQYGEVCEEIHLEDRVRPTLDAPGSLSNAPINKANWYYDNSENREVSNNGMTPAPKKREKTTTWIRSTTRVSSLTMRQDKAKDSRIWGSPHTKNFTASKGNTFGNYGKGEKRFSLKNSISLGERMWERSSIRDKNQERLWKTTAPDGLSNLTSDIETLGETEERNLRLKNRRSKAVIRSRSMTLRRTFTKSIAKLRGKVSFNGSSKGTVIPPSPGSKQSGKGHFYQACCNEETINIQNTEVLGERNKFSISESDVSSIIFRPSLPKEMLEHQSAIELSKVIFPGGGDIITQDHNAEPCIASLSYHGVHSDRATDDRTVSYTPGFKTTVEESNSRPRPWSTIYDDCVTLPFDGSDVGEGSEDAENDSHVDTQLNGPFRVSDENAKEIWRDARESLEITV